MPRLRRSTPEISAAAASLELAVPRDFGAAYGRGLDRGLCLGGGGLFLVAWQSAYLQTLADHGLHVDNADRVVGTSAGSVVASALVGGKLKRLHSEASLLSRVPALASALAPASTLSPSQQRALELFLKATDGDPATVQEIGHASLAAATLRPEVVRRNVSLAVGTGPWPSDALRITCVDAYTGERCVVTRRSRTSVARAVSASIAVPGDVPTPARRRPAVHGRRGQRYGHPSRPAGRRRAGS